MEKVSINLQNCFGIDNLQYEFDFTKDSTYAIYARNGLMKTSFAKTFQKIQQGKKTEIQDAIFGGESLAEVKIDGRDIESTDVFVIKSFESSYESDISSLLVNSDIKQQLKEVLKSRDKLLKAIEKASGMKIKKTSAGKTIYELESTIISDFELVEHSILLNLEFLSEQKRELECADISYSAIFDPTVLKKIKTKEFQNSIKNFVEESDRVYNSFEFLEKGNLTFPKLKDLRKSLEKDSFFVKNNQLVLAGRDTIPDVNALGEKIDEIDKSIKQIPELKSIESMLTDAKGMLLKDIIEMHPEIVPFLSEEKLPILKKSLWISYLNKNNVLFEDLQMKFKTLSLAIDAIDLDDTPWKDALDIFNKRFTVPFKMKISNLKGAIIGESVPQIEFTFSKGREKRTIDRTKLEELDTLSQGEKRALYLLNIIFDLERIKEAGKEMLIIVDDIADSFDYKNKYAIIEYLYELSQNEKNKILILSHNYDFYRTISSRIPVSRKCRLFADNNDAGIKFIQEKYQKQPFDYWKTKPNRKFVLALIPFVRNIIEFGKERNISSQDDDADFLLLTALLHEKDNTHEITFSDILALYNEYIGVSSFENDVILNDKVLQTLYDVCNDITDSDVDLENKILLAMATRHKAEAFMINELKNYSGQLTWNRNRDCGNTTEFLNYIDTKGNQTRELMNGYLQIGDESTKKIMSEVNLMTPENIHLNSFMYEPILDMDIAELLRLYNQVKIL